ncbi:hypothetical protein B0A52_01400 [Exophiala mesophila]|uniref:DUF1330 domain-containing protein n=1 Tax=Exophiala mesophila TaxID=212818 RepID=A0A438NHC7_EXOME|nr:hypothetical protein B0A52_01400 [Exophiala mesophila]
MTSKGIEIGNLNEAAKVIPADKPYIMTNMMKFHETAQYAPDFPGKAQRSGREAYLIYKDAFLARAAELGITAVEFVFLGQAHTNLALGAHHGESWDLILLARFQNFAAFRTVLEDKVYLNEITPHRLAAMQDFRSYAVTELSGL